jgi:mono/diheme cytochrome c family protein
MGQGSIHWTGNFDEIQDFEAVMRSQFGGLGFLPDAAFNAGTRKEPFGDAKAGLNAELDALAAYVTSLSEVNPSPFKNPDGSLTEDAARGKALFLRLGCDGCHGGTDFTNSSADHRYDVGTMKPTSGTRLSGALDGIDTPTLLGIWETAPYLHDGSALTVRDVLTTSNTGDHHGATSALSESELDALSAYLLQIDGDPTPRRLPFETSETPTPTVPRSTSSSGCSVVSTSNTRAFPTALLFLLLVFGMRRVQREDVE